MTSPGGGPGLRVELTVDGGVIDRAAVARLHASSVTDHRSTAGVADPRRVDRSDRSHRVQWIDGARGLSILWMILGHTVAFVGIYINWFEYVVMRPVAPMFLLLLGMLWRPGFRRRHVQFIGAMIAAQLMAALLGFLAFPNIFVLMGAGLLLMPFASRWPLATVALCVTQLQFWPLPDWWTGYAPGFVLALMVCGHSISSDGMLEAFGRFGHRIGAGTVGRFPMTFYLGHLAIFLAIRAL